jgi:hypothetical protein
MMSNFMTSGAFSKGRKGAGGKGVAPILLEAES